MAAEFLKGYGFDLQNIIQQAQAEGSSSVDAESLGLAATEPVARLESVLLAGSSTQLFDITIDVGAGTIKSIEPAKESRTAKVPFSPDVKGCLVLPSLCHAHIHLDKPYLLSHRDTAHLRPESGRFDEALSLTAEAKKLYTTEALLERGNWLIADSVRAGVTHMRAFVEVDATVKHMCVRAGLELKRLWAGRCEVQICVFAQDPIMTGEHAEENRELIAEAIGLDGVDVFGSTPYVEADDESGRKNIDWAIDLAIEHEKHLDFHLDYNLDANKTALVWHVIQSLHDRSWTAKQSGKTVCLGHCTRLALFGADEWRKLAESAQSLPISFVGLPTSDVFMQGRPEKNAQLHDRPRGTLQIPHIINDLGLNAALSLNNVGNAFTPHGSADPLGVAALGVGLYQVGTADQAKCLYECVSTRAREAIGMPRERSLLLEPGHAADLVVFGPAQGSAPALFRRRTSVQEIVYDAPRMRRTILAGKDISTSLGVVREHDL